MGSEGIAGDNDCSRPPIPANYCALWLTLIGWLFEYSAYDSAPDSAHAQTKAPAAPDLGVGPQRRALFQRLCPPTDVRALGQQNGAWSCARIVRTACPTQRAHLCVSLTMPPQTDSSVLERLEEFFASPDFTSAIGHFVAEHASDVEFVPPDEEQPLKCVDARCIWPTHASCSHTRADVQEL